MTQISIKDFNGGIDKISAKNNIPDTFSESIVNMDVTPGKYLNTRKGYESYYGWLPLRVNKVVHSGKSIRFYFDTAVSINLSNTNPTPIVVYGRLDEDVGATSGDLSSTDSVTYYSTFEVTNKTTTAGSGTTETFTQYATDMGYTTKYIWTGISKSTSINNQSNQVLDANAIKVDETAFDVEVDYVSPTSEDLYIYTLDKTASTGTSYIETVSAASSTTIPAATHNLDNYNILVKCFDTTINSGYLTEIEPASVTISTLGEVVVTTPVNMTGYVMLSACPAANRFMYNAATTGLNTIEIEEPGSPYNFIGVYYNNGSTYEQVDVHDISYDAATDTISIQYYHNQSAEYVEVYWENAEIVGNVIQVTDAGGVSESYTDSNPQLTVWGIGHEGIYSTSLRGGHVVYLDSYTKLGDTKLLAGLGGNVYAATPQASGSAYNIPTFDVYMENRMDATTILAPLFTDSANSRSRGEIIDTSVDSNYCTIVSATYVDSSNFDYELEFDSAQTITGKVSTNDYFTITNMPYSELNGTFKFVSVSDDGTTNPTIRLTNTSGKSRFSCTGTKGQCGCFTDLITLEETNRFLPGDTISYFGLASTFDFDILHNETASVTVDSVTTVHTLPDGLRFYAKRTSNTFPLKIGTTQTVEDLVKGDMLTIGSRTNKFKVKGINIYDDATSVTIVGDGTTAQVTTNTDYYNIGDYFSINDTLFGGTHLITNKTSTYVEFSSTVNDTTSSARIIGKTITIDDTIEIDASEIPSVTVEGRWIPIEAPESDFDTVTDSYSSHFSGDYDNQLDLKSTMMNDNMYLTNGVDPVFKYDGTNLYRAGLIKWQPYLFSQVDTTAGGIAAASGTETFDDHIGKKFKFSSTVPNFTIGQRIQDENSVGYFVTAINDTSVTVDKIISGSFSTKVLTPITTYKYYFRLNAVDANNNRIASAVTGSDDCVIELAAAGTVKHRLVGLPSFDIYDYDRIQLQMYRTKADDFSVYYLNRTLMLDFDQYNGYVDIEDAISDETLSDVDQTSVLLSGEFGTTFNEPIRAKYITSTGNKLILGNLTGYPKFDIVFRKKPNASTLAASRFNGKIFTFRKDATSTETDTDDLNVINFECISSGSVAVVPSNITTTATTFTLHFAGTISGYTAGNWIYLFHAAAGVNNDLTFAGWFKVAAVGTDYLTINFSNHGRGVGGGTAYDIDKLIYATDRDDVPVWIGADGNLNQREGNLHYTSNGEVTIANRMASAINATQRICDTTSFTPWLSAYAGNDYDSGRLLVRSPVALSTTPEVVLPTISTYYDVYVDGTLRDTGSEEISSVTSYFPSRIIQSYSQWPELFDAPEEYYDIYSDSARDINASDGQELRGVINFFGDSMYSSAQLNSVIIIFKSHSVYSYDTNTKEYQKIDTRGIGCSSPKSIVSSKDGIYFASESGIYRLNRDLTLAPIGMNVYGYWDETVNRNELTECAGHQYRTGKKFKLSVPVGSDSVNSEVLVNEDEHWCTYNNHYAIWWANLISDAFYSSINGQVFKIRNRGENHDFRDDDEAISVEFISKSYDFGFEGIRKLINEIIVSLQLDDTDLTGASVYSSIDLSDTYQNIGSITLDKDENSYIPVSLDIATNKGNTIRIKLTHNVKDEEVKIVGITFDVDAQTSRSNKQVDNL